MMAQSMDILIGIFQMQIQLQVGRVSPQITYSKVNAYTKRASLQQILAIILFLIVLVLYSLFVASAISQQHSSILWIMLVVTYLFLLLIFADYCLLTCQDPVDDLILGIKKHRQSEVMKYCKICKLFVHHASYHCHSCNRCVEYFDHHCKYLNNCIGGKNYTVFIRLLVVVTIFSLLIIGQGIWIFVQAYKSSDFNSAIVSKWGVLASIIFTFIMVFTVDTLLCFHLYLLFYLKKSTLAYLQDQSQTSKQHLDQPQ